MNSEGITNKDLKSFIINCQILSMLNPCTCTVYWFHYFTTITIIIDFTTITIIIDVL